MIAVICLSLNIMTSQSHTGVQCVTNGFRQKDNCLVTFERTLNRTRIRVLIVRSVILIAIA